MSNAASRAKTKWNVSNYSQIKVSVSPEVAASFKSACIAAGISMASELSRFMAEYGSVEAISKSGKKAAADTQPTKKKRNRTVCEVICKLKWVRDAEEQAMENIPENLRGAGNYENLEERAALIGEALDILESLY